MRKEIDLHGLNLDEALIKLHLIVGRVRLTEPEEWSFITGSGNLQNTIIEEIKEYGLDVHIPSHNLGVIHVNIE